MTKFVLRILFNAVGLFVATKIVPGISVSGSNEVVTYLVVALIFGIVNALVRPVLAVLSCPLEILTLGLFTFVLNALMLLLTSAIAGSFGLAFQIHGDGATGTFVAALLGSIVISIVSFVLSLFISDRQERSR